MTDLTPPFVIHVNEMGDYPDAVYIGRAVPRRKLKASKWANPYKINKYGRAGAIGEYRAYLAESVISEIALPALSELTGKPLACWCRSHDDPRTDDNMCHGDVLVELWHQHVEGTSND